MRIEKTDPDARGFKDKDEIKQIVKNYNKERKGQYNWMVLSLKRRKIIICMIYVIYI